MNYGREAITLVEIDQPLCRNVYGVAPCAAALGTTGTRKCFNTRVTCQDPDHYDVAARGQLGAADFDGTDSLARGAALTGIADAKKGLLSVWVRFDGSDGATQTLLSDVRGGSAPTWLGRSSSNNTLQFDVFNAASSQDVVFLQSVDTYGTSSAWRHVLAAWDAATGAMHLYIGDVDALDRAESHTNDLNSEWTLSTDWYVGKSTFGEFLDGCLAELYFAPGQYLDLSVEDNRRKFISAEGKAVDLGATGAVPTGVAPLVYLHLDADEAVADFALNRGTGGNFSISGTLAAASTAPPAGEEASVLTLRFAFDQDGVPDYGPLLPALTGLTTTPGSINLAGMDTAASALGTREVVTLKFDDSLHSDLGVDPYRLERIDGAAQQE